MAFGEIAKQLAAEAIRSQAGEGAKPAPAVQPDSLAGIMVGQVQAMQKALKDDEELAVFLHSGAEAVRVHEIILPSQHVVVFGGFDAGRHLTRVVAHIASVQLVCKVVKVAPGAKPVRVAVLAPKGSHEEQRR